MNKETLRMQMLAGIITEGQYKEKLNEIEDLSSPETFQKFIDQIPNEKYFYIGDEEADWAFNREELPEPYNWEAFDDDSDGDLVDYFYDDVFNNELKGKPGVEGEDFSEFQDADAEKDNVEAGYIGRRTTILVDKIRDIITAYKKTHFVQNASSKNKNPLIDYTAWDIDSDDIDEYGDYDETSNTFEVESGSDSMADMFDTVYKGTKMKWWEDESVAKDLNNFYTSLIEKAAKEKYGNDVKIEYY